MNCMNCGARLTNSDYCPECGCDISVQRKAYQLSNLYYNKGLEKAEIRDLSGAIDLLKRSLKFNKLNIQARNLLGLVYFETGEAVAALSEWVISKNIMPDYNIASQYIQKLQAEPNKLDNSNQTIKKYNEALKCCREGNEDVAAIQLKKILAQNPKLIKGYHLLALIYIKNEKYEKARRILKKAARIDKTNSTTLRFLKEVDEQTGTATKLEQSRWGRKEKTPAGEEGIRTAYVSGNDTIIQPPTFRESSSMATLLNLGIGVLVGACVVGFLVVPAVKQGINRSANEKVVEYSNTMASQSATLDELNEQIAQSQATVESAQQQIAQANDKVTSYENLIKAQEVYSREEYTNAANVLQNVNREQLSVEAQQIYDNIYDNVKTTLFRSLKKDGVDAFDREDYPTAIDLLTKAKEINDEDYQVLNTLAHAYRSQGSTAEAIAAFQEIVEKFPGKRADSAKNYIEQLGGTGTADTGEESAEGGSAGAESTGGDSAESAGSRNAQDGSENGSGGQEDEESGEPEEE